MQNRWGVRLAWSCALSLAVCASAVPAMGAERLTFTRTIPSPHDLGNAHHFVFIYALGDSDKMRLFVDTVASQISRLDDMDVEDVTDRGQHLFGTPDERVLHELHKRHPADAYLGVKRFTCHSDTHTSASERKDAQHHDRRWIEATCEARLDVLDGASLQRLFAIDLHGKGASVPAETLALDDEDHALDEAARHAALDAVENIAPRRVKESIELDESAPGFDEAIVRIYAGQYDQARTVFQNAQAHGGPSAALHFDIAAVCEAAGDLACARMHYEQAQALAPADKRFRRELKMFLRRASEATRPVAGEKK